MSIMREIQALQACVEIAIRVTCKAGLWFVKTVIVVIELALTVMLCAKDLGTYFINVLDENIEDDPERQWVSRNLRNVRANLLLMQEHVDVVCRYFRIDVIHL